MMDDMTELLEITFKRQYNPVFEKFGYTPDSFIQITANGIGLLKFIV